MADSEVPWGYRAPEDEHLFDQRTDDPTIQSDLISPSHEGYFRFPAIWVDKEPEKETAKALNRNVHHEEVLKRSLNCDIKVRVWRDGTFVFDFSSWPLAPSVTITGYRIPSNSTSYKIPPDHSHAEELAESHAVLRAQVMNVHQLCLSSAEMTLKRRSASTGFPVTAWNTLKGISPQHMSDYHDDTEDSHALARNVLNNSYEVQRAAPLTRRVVEMEVINHSFNLLYDILSKSDPGLIQILEGAYIAACRCREKRFGEAVTLSWTVCEQLISSIWNEFLTSQKNERNMPSECMPKQRRDKLKGRDFTASIVVEVLELNGCINHDLYRMLEISRKSRNHWVHEMRPPKEREVITCIRAVEQLLKDTFDFQIAIPISGRGGVPLWPTWLYREINNIPS